MHVSRSRRSMAATLLIAVVVAFTAACAPTPAPAPTATVGAPTGPSDPSDPAATPDPEETGGVSAEDVTCETLTDADAVADMTARGWTPREDPFFIGDLSLPDGISCTWGDFSVETGDNLLLFAWAPISESDAEASRTALVEEGWIVEESEDGVYLTEDPEQAIVVDDEGYGMTYLFGDGWVTLSDTKQGLVLIERPAL